jgi:hypothetical protein
MKTRVALLRYGAWNFAFFEMLIALTLTCSILAATDPPACGCSEESGTRLLVRQLQEDRAYSEPAFHPYTVSEGFPSHSSKPTIQAWNSPEN